jgi:NADH:ubiquinone oxidoreductase subunit E
MLSPESLKKIDQEIAKYPADQKQSASMSALRIAQQEKGGWQMRRSSLLPSTSACLQLLFMR